MALPTADLDDFVVPIPRTPRRNPSNSKRSALSFSHEKLSSPTFAPPRNNLLLRNPPQTHETSYDSAPSKSLHFIPPAPAEDTTTTRSGFFSLRHRSSAAGLQSGRSTPALLNTIEAIAEGADRGTPSSPAARISATTSLRGTFRKMFGKSVVIDGARSESRAASRQSDRVSCSWEGFYLHGLC